MSDENIILLETELFKEVVSPIEVFITENMTPQDKALAKSKVFGQIQESINEFSKSTGESREEILKILIEMVIKKKETTHFKEQYEMVFDMLKAIKGKEEEERN